MRLIPIVAVLAGLGLAVPAHAAALVLGGGLARDCYLAARGLKPADGASGAQLAVCTAALERERLSVRDRAGTLVNRGILRMSRREYETALGDYAAALRLAPNSGVAQVNRGAALVALGRPQEGVAAIDRGLALGAEEPEKAYFNRGYAREQLGDVKGAWEDFSRAAELRPDWDLPRRELQRFHVRAPAAGDAVTRIPDSMANR